MVGGITDKTFKTSSGMHLLGSRSKVVFSVLLIDCMVSVVGAALSIFRVSPKTFRGVGVKKKVRDQRSTGRTCKKLDKNYEQQL